MNFDRGWHEEEVQSQLTPMKEKVEKVEKEKEVDEARQCGMKGNLILSTRPDKNPSH